MIFGWQRKSLAGVALQGEAGSVHFTPITTAAGDGFPPNRAPARLNLNEPLEEAEDRREGA